MATRTAVRPGLLLTPGAGTAADHPGLVAIETAVRHVFPHVDVVRMDFPYRLAGRRAPDRAPVLIDAVRAGVAGLRARLPAGAPVVIGGRSMGGRMCSMAVAEGEPVAGLICLAYPLHPPGKPDRLRIDHLPQITVPSLFVSGTRDSFGTPDELRSHLATVPGPLALELLDGVGHDLRRCDDRIAAIVVEWMSNLLPNAKAPSPRGR